MIKMSYIRKGKALKKIKLKARHTKIHTEKGFKAIETIKPGDRVWSENPETNSKALKKVKKIFVREKDSLIRLAINGEVIETTDEHPFYVEGRGFTAAKELKTGDEVRLEDGTAARIESSETRQLDRPVKVYDFEVEDYHTYYVSEQKVLVHNTCARNKNNDTVINKEKSLFLPEEYYKKIDNNIAKAIKARDEEVARIQSLSKNQQKDITTVAAGVDLRTEEVFVGAKSSNVYAGQTTCAEDIVFRGLGGNHMANIIMTSAVRPRNGAIIPVCARCQCKYPINQFVKGTTFQ